MGGKGTGVANRVEVTSRDDRGRLGIEKSGGCENKVKRPWSLCRSYSCTTGRKENYHGRRSRLVRDIWCGRRDKRHIPWDRTSDWWERRAGVRLISETCTPLKEKKGSIEVGSNVGELGQAGSGLAIYHVSCNG